MSLLFIHEAVVHVTDLDEAVRFHAEAFGFAEVTRTATECLMSAPGAVAGRIRLVAVDPVPDAPRPRPWDLGPRLLGIYSHDLEATQRAVRAAGGESREPVTYPYGAASLSELVAQGTAGVWWTIPRAVPGQHRPSAAYEAEPDRLHSELHTAVLVVEDHDAALAFFEAAGLSTVFDGAMSGEPFESLVGMPTGAELRLSFMGGPDHLPARLELMSFTGTDSRDLSGNGLGVVGLVYACDDVERTRTSLVAAGATPGPNGSLLGPVGIELHLVEAGTLDTEGAAR